MGEHIQGPEQEPELNSGTFVSSEPQLRSVSKDKDNVELIALFPKFRCTDKFGREWLLLVPEEMDVPPKDSTIIRALADILSTPPLGLKQVEIGKIWLSSGRQIAYRFGYPNEPIKRWEEK